MHVPDPADGSIALVYAAPALLLLLPEVQACAPCSTAGLQSDVVAPTGQRPLQLILIQTPHFPSISQYLNYERLLQPGGIELSIMRRAHDRAGNLSRVGMSWET